MRTVRLREVADIERRGVDPTALDPATHYIGLEHIERGGRIVGRESVAEANLSSTKFQFTPEHVLFGKLRPNLGKIARPDVSGVCSTDILPIRPSKSLDRDYLFHYLSQPTMIAFAASRASGANLPRLSPAVLSTFEVPLPPLAEQRRIAAILDHADALRAKRREVIAHLDDLAQAIFTDMFGDPVMNPHDWPRVDLGDVVPHIDSGMSPVCEARSAEGDEWAVLKLGSVSYGVFNPAENKAFLGDVSTVRKVEVQVGDLLFSRKNTKDLVGATVVVHDVPARRLLPDLIFRLTLEKDRIESEYLRALLSNPTKRPQVVALASGSASSMSNISKARLSRLPIELPPLNLQQQYARRLVKITGFRAEQLQCVRTSEQLFASLQSRAFRGEL